MIMKNDWDKFNDETITLLKEMQENCKNSGSDESKSMEQAEALSTAISAINIMMRAKMALLDRMTTFLTHEINSEHKLCKDCAYNESADEEYSTKLICGKHSKIVDVRDEACKDFEECESND